MSYHLAVNEDCRYGRDEYPTWAEALGLMMSLSSMVMVPGYAVYYVLCQPGTIVQNIRQGLKPSLTLRREVSVMPEHGEVMTLFHRENPLRCMR